MQVKEIEKPSDSNEYKSVKIQIARIYLSYVRLILDLKDFIWNAPIAIEKYKNHRVRLEKSRYLRYPLEKIIQWDKNLMFEITLIKIISEYENFLKVFFHEIEKVEKLNKFPKNAKNINRLSEYLETTFRISISTELECWDKLVENYYRRNAYVHNKGKVDRSYLKNVPNYTKERLGDKL
ncbi:MAG: hypothetical protein ACFFFT_00220 [Candidatus Thorarchaeota archaeon]